MNALEALSNPTRRRIVELLCEREHAASDIASHFRTSRPGISRHLRVLRDHGLVRVREDGQRRLYSVEPAPLAELDEWLTRYRRFWTNRLDALETEVRRRQRQSDKEER